MKNKHSEFKKIYCYSHYVLPIGLCVVENESNSTFKEVVGLAQLGILYDFT